MVWILFIFMRLILQLVHIAFKWPSKLLHKTVWNFIADCAIYTGQMIRHINRFKNHVIKWNKGCIIFINRRLFRRMMPVVKLRCCDQPAQIGKAETHVGVNKNGMERNKDQISKDRRGMKT